MIIGLCKKWIAKYHSPLIPPGMVKRIKNPGEYMVYFLLDLSRHHRFFSMEGKTAVDAKRPHFIASQKDKEVEDPLKTRMNSRRFGTTRFRRLFDYFLDAQKVIRRRNPWACEAFLYCKKGKFYITIPGQR